MKDFNKSHELIRQNENLVKKSQKHDANLQKNSTLYFQIGLIMCLLAAYGALEMQFTTNDYVVQVVSEIDEDYMYDIKQYVVKNEPVEVVEELPQRKQKVIDKIKAVDNLTEIKDKAVVDFVEVKKVTKKAKVVDPNDIPTIEEPKGPFNILAVQKVPIYPGCEGETTNEARIKCMSAKLSKHIDRKFNRDLASDLGLKKGLQRIYVQFKINKKGEVEIIETKAPHKRLAKEANRVVNKVPTMKPGLVNDKSVDVLYMIPISFQIN